MARTLKAIDPKAAKPKKPKILIFGKPGAGKTWASLDFPSVYYIDTEGGASLAHYTDKLAASGGLYLGPDAGANDFNVVLDEVITLATTPHKFKTLVIDSYSKLFNTQIDASLERLTRESKEKNRDFDPTKTFGAEKKEAITYTRRLIRWFDKLDMNVILICHEKAQWKDGKEIGHTFDAWDKLEYELNLALHIVKQGASRKARITDKTRLLGFPPNEVFDWSYASFAERYGRDVMEAEAKPTQLATAEQIKLFNDLLAVVKVDAKVLEKWDENGDPAELACDDLQKRIDYLNKLLPAKAKETA
jgi:hypothetical protein